MRILVALAGMAAVAVAGRSVQGPETCRPQLDSVGGRGRQIQLAPGRVHYFAGGGVYFHCIGQETRFRADSVAWYSELNRLDLIGNVQFRDSVTTLDAQRARYLTVDERLEAFDEVRLENERTGSVLTGPHLTYYRAVPGLRDTTELYADRSPMVEYRSGPDATAPYVIRPLRVRLRGEDEAWAGGGVTIEREDFTAQSDSAELELQLGTGLLIGNAQAAGGDSVPYTIRGARLAFRLVEDELTWVQAQGQAHATSADWRVTGDTIEFNVAEDLIQGGAVWGDSARSQAISQTYAIAADSLALDAPDQVLTEVRGIGRAVATSAPDSIRPEPDWIAGDTVIARFDDTESGGRELAALDAWGNARAYYHIFDEAEPEGPPAINYSRGARIAARFRDEELQEVVIMEGGDGIYLEPSEVRRP
jgi:hypothetical protein